MIVEDSGEHLGMSTAFVSERIPVDVYGFCFSFYFSLSGDPDAKLNVSVRTDQGKDLLWALSGDQGQDWVYGQVRARRLRDTAVEAFWSGVALGYVL